MAIGSETNRFHTRAMYIIHICCYHGSRAYWITPAITGTCYAEDNKLVSLLPLLVIDD